MNLLIADLKVAFREPCCPVCHLRRDSEGRYLFSLLWEYVNDANIRVKLVRSLGFCHQHAWQLQETEQRIWGDGLGTGIIYEDLIQRVHAALQNSSNNCHVPSGLLPRGRCRVCEIGEGSEQTYITWLLHACENTEFRGQYRDSDGLCLPHLRQALTLDEEGTDTAKLFVIESAIEKMKMLSSLQWVNFLVGRHGPKKV